MPNLPPLNLLPARRRRSVPRRGWMPRPSPRRPVAIALADQLVSSRRPKTPIGTAADARTHRSMSCSPELLLPQYPALAIRALLAKVAFALWLAGARPTRCLNNVYPARPSTAFARDRCQIDPAEVFAESHTSSCHIRAKATQNLPTLPAFFPKQAQDQVLNRAELQPHVVGLFLGTRQGVLKTRTCRQPPRPAGSGVKLHPLREFLSGTFFRGKS